jgi:hypothetical protein
MNIKIDNMVDLRAFCLEQAVKMKSANFKECKNTMEMVIVFEKYILGNAKLPETPSSFDNVLQEYMKRSLNEEISKDSLANNKNE